MGQGYCWTNPGDVRCHDTFTLLCVTVWSLFPFPSLAFRSLVASHFLGFSQAISPFCYRFYSPSHISFSFSPFLRGRYYNFCHHSNYIIGLLLLVLLHTTPLFSHFIIIPPPPCPSVPYYGIPNSLQHRHRRRRIQQ